jgi:hypothetical protein
MSRKKRRERKVRKEGMKRWEEMSIEKMEGEKKNGNKKETLTKRINLHFLTPSVSPLQKGRPPRGDFACN